MIVSIKISKQYSFSLTKIEKITITNKNFSFFYAAIPITNKDIVSKRLMVTLIAAYYLK